jgi:hypothetical protein
MVLEAFADAADLVQAFMAIVYSLACQYATSSVSVYSDM